MGKAGPDIAGVPEVYASGQGGLLDVALAPDFETSNRIFFSYAEPREGGNGTTVASARLALNDDGGGNLEDVKVIFRQTPTYDGDKHFGSRLVFGPKGELFVTVGERSDAAVRAQAQDISSGLGKVFRIDQRASPCPTILLSTSRRPPGNLEPGAPQHAVGSARRRRTALDRRTWPPGRR